MAYLMPDDVGSTSNVSTPVEFLHQAVTNGQTTLRMRSALALKLEVKRELNLARADAGHRPQETGLRSGSDTENRIDLSDIRPMKASPTRSSAVTFCLV